MTMDRRIHTHGLACEEPTQLMNLNVTDMAIPDPDRYLLLHRSGPSRCSLAKYLHRITANLEYINEYEQEEQADLNHGT